MTPSEIKPATFRLVAQCPVALVVTNIRINHLKTHFAEIQQNMAVCCLCVCAYDVPVRVVSGYVQYST